MLFCFLVFFSPFNIAITSLGEERANLSAYRTFVRFARVWLSVSYSFWCLLLFPLASLVLYGSVVLSVPGYILYY